VKRLTMLATAAGEWVLEDSPAFFAALGDPEPDYDGAAFAVKNLGFIRFQILDNSVVEIELHPRTVELPALLAVQEQLQSCKIKLFRIRYLDIFWKSEIIPSSELAALRLSELCTPMLAPPHSERFLAEQRDFSKLVGDSESPLGLIAQKWRMSFGSFDPTVISFAIKHQLLSRMMIVGVKPRRVDPIFRFIGDGFNWLTSDFQFRGIGQRIENQPDKEYGAWVTEFYKFVAESGEPRYDIVRAAIQTKAESSQLFLTRYERLLLPWKTPSDEVFVTLSSKRLLDEETAPAIPEPDVSLRSASVKSS
jgi:hypothetical protein